MTNTLQSMDFRLSYADCDPLGIVFYAAYYGWMERTYNEWVFSGGLTNDECIARWGVNTVMRASGLEYFVPAVLFDGLSCRMRLDAIGNTSFTVIFDIVRRKDEVQMAKGFMTLVTVNRSGRPAEVPGELATLLRGDSRATEIAV